MKIKAVHSIKGVSKSLNNLLIDSVASGASIGFIAPLSLQSAHDYWQGVDRDLATPYRRLYLALNGDTVIGSVQLSLCAKANGAHRGEVEKLMVHSEYQGQGIAKQLMNSLETDARILGLQLLLLDTRQGDTASYLYRKLDYIEAGTIPGFAKSSSGEFDATVYFYKQVA
ncbi:GNAT family N-acetyltransferase [Pseudoalteromonas sp. S2721]|jgi:ribosomal protein S18 acetylase RimI-like enzyme|uniref:GNAT family N-acetyltransferase n=1 Tax=Pseudoalteromonas sp. S2721 TaxID=579526 RepID=UPI00110B4473|nr:GNAT family N-acetyltransferase [Pseudoalteromonas sp. S2721]TMP18593.1 GNAT family N-acetyltransferase [Pseudoalteromonas sp. S2721]|tara:strand:+ start:1658 stop:2167 length:510 start_codon:yes stop_codon:yes gene_type:complete